jgi:hypothetical protein
MASPGMGAFTTVEEGDSLQVHNMAHRTCEMAHGDGGVILGFLMEKLPIQ